MRRNAPVFALFVILIWAAAPVSGHHSLSAEFDTDQPIEFSGTVTKIDWMNPHIYTHVLVKQDDGTEITYKVEGSPPNALYRRGWRKDSLQAGDFVTVAGIRAKNPESPNIGSARITTEDGRTIFSGTGPN
jgi:hypothetical protein